MLSERYHYQKLARQLLLPSAGDKAKSMRGGEEAPRVGHDVVGWFPAGRDGRTAYNAQPADGGRTSELVFDETQAVRGR